MSEDNWIDLLNDWYKNQDQDPLTSYLDESEFRVDIYESEKEYIVEALLPDSQDSNIDIDLTKDSLTIRQKDVKEKRRTIFFPITLSSSTCFSTKYKDEILEIFIPKNT